MTESAQPSALPVAIVGIGCRLPGGADDPASFWSLLIEGRSGIRDVPADRWNLERFYHSDPAVAGAMVMKRGGFVANLADFDASFWGLSPREAIRMDPQQRWLLEVAWEAIEDAGVAPSRLRGRRVGVFVGISGNDYGGLQLRSTEDVDAYTNSGSTASIASNRISFMLDLTGPSVSLDTACSSSLVAIAAACDAIRAGRCEGALAGGVNALISPQTSVGFSKASMISPTGQCFAFDARANGFVRAEGAALVYLKPLAAAIAAGDRIYAVIRSASVNQDGHTSSMTVPGLEGQTAMLEQAYRDAGIDPARVVYVEAHGTGTPVGDPIEAGALGRVLGRGRQRPCLIGSVKTNIGHLESASGIAGLIKAALVVHHRTIPATLNHEQPNPAIPFAELRLQVAASAQPLTTGAEEHPVVGVNSFGFGGTNAHAVLEGAPAADPLGPTSAIAGERPLLLPISARDETALRQYAQAYRTLLADPLVPLPDVCAAAGERKEHHSHRLVVMGSTATEMRAHIGGWLRDGAHERALSGRAGTHSAPVFVFAGQGPQWWAMGRQLLEREPLVRDIVVDIDRRIESLAGWSLLTELRRSEADSRIDHTDIAQPAIFALQVALAELWESWGVRPATVIGHSVGEVAAAYCAGVYSLADAVRIIVHRSRLQHTTFGGGRMLAAAVSAEDARKAIGDERDVEVGAINSPRFVTLAGTADALRRVEATLQNDGVFMRWLRGGYAFHSAQMDPIRDELLQALDGIDPQPTRIPMLSTVTGAAIDGEAMDAAYWFRNIREAVLFGPAVANAIRTGARTFLEISPHPVLESAIKECLAEQGETAGAVFHSLRRETDESRELASGLAAMHIAGLPVAWNAFNRGSGAVVRLPRYPWNRERFWIESAESQRVRLEPVEHPLLGQRIAAATPTWQATLDVRRLRYLEDHRVWESIVFPAAAYCEIGLALARLLFGEERHAVEQLEIKKALFLSEAARTTLQTVFNAEDKTFAIYSAPPGSASWELHAQGTLSRVGVTRQSGEELGAVRARLREHLDRAGYCAALRERGYQFGAAFTQVQHIWSDGPEVLTQIEAPETIAAATAGYAFHPAILDACFHTFIGLPATAADDSARNLYLPHSLGRLQVHVDDVPTRLWAHGIARTPERGAIVADVAVYDDNGRRVADMLDFRMERVDPKQKAAAFDDCCYQFAWQPRRLRGSGIHGSCAYPSSGAIADQLAAALPAINERHALDEYFDGYVPDARRTVVRLIQRALLDLGWKPRVGASIQLDGFMDALGVQRDYERVTRRLLDTLVEAGVLARRGIDQWTIELAPDGTGAEAAVEALAAKYPACAAEVELFRRTGTRLANVLTGDSDPLDLLFPGGSHVVMERFYSEALAFPAHLETTRVAIDAAIASVPKDRAIRVLEVGAGTGVLTRTILPILPATRTEYLFTDIGAAFVAAARKRFADYPFVDYQVLDIEADPASQEVAEGQFDLVLAADVIHATADVRRSLGHLRRYTAPSGLVVLLELATPDFGRDDVTFGLLRGYSRFTDTALRPHSALMEPATWARSLEEAGFTEVRALGCRADVSSSEHAVIVGFAPAAVASGPPSPDARLSQAAGPYIILADESGVANALGRRLESAGHTVVVVSGVDARTLPILEYQKAVGVIDCRALDRGNASTLTIADLRAAQQAGVLSACHLIQTLAGTSARAWFVTRDGWRVTEHDGLDGLSAASLTGLVRVANNEQQCRFAIVDLDGSGPDESARHLFDEITLPGDQEFEVAYRGGSRFVPRLNRVSPQQLPRKTFNAVAPGGTVTAFRLETSQPGILSNLRLHETRRRAPAANEIEVRVQATGINFRDVMKALGTHPGHPVDLLWFGDDFSGTVERVGPGVTTFQVGDRVAGMAPYAFQSYVVTDARLAFKVPARLSFEEATTIPTVFLTAHYALEHLARMQPGESVLIHAGTGGVGLAAIQIAKHLGLKIFATAGTVDKRRLLTEMGVAHVMNSRTLDFADAIMQATDGRGVDAVLNSLAGDFIPKSLSVLAPFGRFLEIGKVDIYRNAKVGLQRFRDNISYFVVDLTQHLQHKRDFVLRMFEDIAARFETGSYEPIRYTAFPVTEAVEAFRFMAQGRHVGKNVLTFNHPVIPVACSTEPAELFRPDATYLVTGGAGGFGFEAAKWIAARGGRHLVLMSRSGPTTTASADIEALESSGVTVVDARGDVTSEADVARVVAQIERDLPPLKGVFHAAMVLDDALITELDEQRFTAVLDPKMAGAWNLHRATEHLPLDYFISFSSFSNVIGMLRQSNYNAGNAFLDALAQYRRARGLPALTVNWGAILGAGFVERHQKTADTLVRLGFGSFDKDEALRLLDTVIVTDAPNVVAARVDWDAAQKLSPLVATSRAYGSLTSESQSATLGRSLDAQLRGASPAEQERLLETFIVAQVAGVFGMAEEKVNRSIRLNELGLDSLMTLELTNRVERELGVRIPMASLLSGPTIVDLAKTVRQLIAPGLQAGEGAGAPTPEAEAVETPRVIGDQIAAADGSAVDHLVRIKEGTDRPIFCFHPVGGGVGIYAGLSPHLESGQPLLGIESRVVRGAAREYQTLEEMVDAYVDTVRIADNGPYRLFGFSFGGYLAACVAERLEASGQSVELVGIVDWDAQQKLTATAQRESLVRLSMASYRFMQEEMGILEPRGEHLLHDEISAIVEQVASQPEGGGDAFFQWVVANELTSSTALQDLAREYLVRFEQHCRLLTQGLPRPAFTAPLVVWRASRGFGSPLSSWDRDDTQGEEHVFDGDHNSLMRPAALRTVAEQLTDFLRARASVSAASGAAQIV